MTKGLFTINCMAIKDIPVDNVEFNDATRDIPTLLPAARCFTAACKLTEIHANYLWYKALILIPKSI